MLKMYIIVGILGFLILVVLHELGHFIASRYFGVKVHEFGIGIPPKIKTLYKDKKGTEYTINLLPIGGFIRPKGENISKDSEINDKDSFHSKPFWQKLIILLGGVFMNLFIAFILFTVAFWHGITPLKIIPDSMYNFTAKSYIFPTTSFAQKIGYIKQQKKEGLKVLGVVKDNKKFKKENLLSLQIPIQTGDIINYIGNEKVYNTNASKLLKNYLGKKVKIGILRNNKQYYYIGTCAKDSCLLGVFYNPNIKIEKLNLNFLQAMNASLQEIKAETILTFEALHFLYKKLSEGKVKQATERLSGPVGAVAVGKYILELGIWEYIAFLGMISLALAIFNVLPIPALDGGRILTTAIMHLFKLNPKKYLVIENQVTIGFFIVLMIFGFYIMGLDIYRIYTGQI